MVDYNNFAKTFSSSRKKLKWEEIDYFLSFLKWKENLNILDIWCGNWRLLSHIIEKEIEIKDFLWVDLSQWLLDEARIIHPKNKFKQLDMLDLDKIEEKFDTIFFIASFHHLKNIEDRLMVLKKAFSLLENDWIIFLTNWSLFSELNKEKYNKSQISWSENKFWSFDYNIKIWEYSRYYHSFSTEELDYLFKEVWFEIIENREFDNKKNIVSIIKKS